MAQAELGQAGAYNSFQQAKYATMNGIAFNQAQMSAQQDQLKAQQSAGMMSAGVGAAGAVPSAAASEAAISALSCWVARERPGTADNRWKACVWMINFAQTLRSLYIRHGRASQPLSHSAQCQSADRSVMLRADRDPGAVSFHPEHSPHGMTRTELRESVAQAINALSRKELLEQFGISRVAELTGLDSAWLPVYTCVRALSATVSIHAGKGLERSFSRAGAILEGIEFEVAEHPYGDWTLARAIDLKEGSFVPLDECFPARSSILNNLTLLPGRSH
jgi:hypothetical protein